MRKEISDYLGALREALRGADQATIQDAISDAEEHLTLALESDPAAGASPASFSSIVAAYGSPEEIAKAYRDLESRTPLPFEPAAPAMKRESGWKRFFGVVADPRAYGALFYLFASLLLGILYFTFATTGLSLSLGLIILIIGLPFVVGFLIATRGIAVLEGRIVEALLGVRMPRRPVFVRKGLPWQRQIKMLFSDRSTWTAILYFVLMCPLGIVYFTLAITLLAVSIAFSAAPLFFLVLGMPLYQSPGGAYYPPDWMIAPFMVGGVLLFILTLHLAKGIGRAHGRFAKTMLVKAE